MTASERQTILDFINSHRYQVISTADESGQTQSALTGFVMTPDFEIVFGTSKQSRKFANLQHDRRCSVVIGFSMPATVQLEGIAIQLTEGLDSSQVKLYLERQPQAHKYASNPDQTWFLITPSWIRYTDYGSHPETIIETSL